MKQETRQTEVNIEEVVSEFRQLESSYQSARAIREKLRTQIIEHAKGQKEAFAGDEKSYHMAGGVVVRRSATLKSRFDEEKMDSRWLARILSTESAAAIKVSIDPKRLHRDAETARLLAEIDYAEETRYSYTVDTTTVENQ
ncbi:MAG: hypothetical protein MJZ67_08665 [Bacteroidales bacterium]|nr:hypothetical protein [Bacteroidales bacterium]